MSKRNIPFIESKRGVKQIKKNMSHGTFRVKRHPNSKRVTNGSEK
jgi:hypothetical protein